MLLALAACAPDPIALVSDSGGAPPIQDTDPPEEAPVVWVDCGEGTECADVSTPLDPGDPDGERFTTHLRRLPTRRSPIRTLWVVVGGPGDAGTALAPVLTFFQDAFPRLEVITYDHRGTGESAPLACPAQQAEDSEEGSTIADAEWPGCRDALLAAGAPLDRMTVDDAADDLAWLVGRVRDPEVPVVVWGISYGTYLAERYLVRHPDQVEGALLDGLVPPDWTFAELDAQMDDTGRRYLALCTADPDCAAHLDGDAVAFAEATLTSLAAAPCDAFDREVARSVLGALLLTGDDRAAIPATLVRLARCDAEDVAALRHLAGTFHADDTQNEPLLVNIGVSELWPADGPSAAVAADALTSAVVATGAGAWMAARAEEWPRHAPGGDPATPRPAVPVLLLHGGLDPTVSLERTEAMRAAWPRAQSVTPPGAGHVTINTSSCAGDAYGAFLADPAGAVVDPCVDEPYAEAFTLSKAAAERVFGVGDGWGG